MFHTIGSNLSAEEKLHRLTKQATLNLSLHLTRLRLITEGFEQPVESFVGVERDYIVGLLYTLNETIAILNSTGGRELIDAVFLQQLGGRDWYDAAIEAVHNAITELPSIENSLKIFDDTLEHLRPSPAREPLPDELGDDEDGVADLHYEDEPNPVN